MADSDPNSLSPPASETKISESRSAEFVDAADAASLAPGQGRTLELRGRRYALFNLDGQFYAIDDSCPHRGGPLGAGYFEGCEVYCPLHGWPFDVRTGQCRTVPARPVRTYPTRVENGKVWIQLVANPGPTSLGDC
jgi:nitrite reductase/ring-hydroxylating ferredoxin subunit